METTPHGRLRKALEEKVAEVIVATLWLLATGVLLKFGDQVFDSVLHVLGKQWLLLLVVLSLFSSAYLFVLLHRARTSKSFFDTLVPVPGAGYCTDPKTGEKICPRCAVKQQRSYLRKMERGFYCQVCHASIDE